MNFSVFLRKKKKAINVTNNQLVEALQDFDDRLIHLDSITLSRWLNGVTSPPLKKQLIVCAYFEDGIKDYLELIDTPGIPTRMKKAYQKVLKELDPRYFNLSYSGRVPESLRLKISEPGIDSHYDSYHPFYSLISTYSEIVSRLKSSKRKLRMSLFELIDSHERIISHVSYCENMKQFETDFLLRDCLPKDNSIVFNVSYYASQEYFEVLVGAAFCNLLKRKGDLLEEVYIFLPGNYFLDFMLGLGGKLVWIGRENSILKNSYIVKFDFIDLISNPLLIIIIKKYITYYKDDAESLGVVTL